MALPSSSNRVSIAADSGIVPDVGIIDLQRAGANTDLAFARGREGANAMIDDVILRPAQRAANVAIANDQASQARTNIELRPQAAATEAARLRSEEAKSDPEGVFRKAEAQVIAIQDDLDKAGQDIVSAHALLGQRKPDGTPAGTEKQVDSAIKKRAKLAAQLDEAQSRLKLLTANRVSAENAAKKAQVESGTALAVSEGAARIAPTVVNTAEQTANAANLAAQGQVAVQPFVNRQALTAAQVGSQVGQIAATPTVEAAAIDAATIPIRARNQQLAATRELSIRERGLDPAQVAGSIEQLQETAKKYGITTLGKTPDQVAAEVNAARNVEVNDAFLKTLDTDAATARTTLANADQIKDLLVGTDTGALYGLPGVETVDRIAAQLGNESSQKREAVYSLAQRLIPQVRANQPGAVSDLEFQVFRLSVPGPRVSNATNAVLLTGLQGMAQRDLDKSTFYRQVFANGADRAQADVAWKEYLDKNPVVTPGAGGQPELNASRFSPTQWVEVLQNPRAAATKYIPTNPREQNVLPLGQPAPDGVGAVGPATVPYVVLGSTVLPNRAYWSQFDSK